MSSILLIYSTTDGHTVKICQRIQDISESLGNEVKLISIDDAPSEDLSRVEKIVIGASIRYGKHNKKVFDFIAQNEAALNNKPSAFFSVNVVARKPNKNKPDNNPYIIKFLSQNSWKPDKVGVFAGKIDYQKYRFFDRLMIRLIMYLTKGPTNPKTVAEFTNWDDVEDFAHIVSKM